MDVVDAERDVVQTRPALLDVLRESPTRRRVASSSSRFVAAGDEVRADVAATAPPLALSTSRPERVAVERERRPADPSHRDADVVENQLS
jgi:hypothetical protein